MFFSFTLRHSGTGGGEVKRAGTTRARRASLPPRSKSAVVPHLAPALRWTPHLVTKRSGRRGRREPRVTCGRAQPRASPPSGCALPPPRSPSAPSHPRAARPVTQPGTGARGPGQPGHVQEEARPEQTRALARPALHVSARLARGPSTPSTGPRTAEVGTGNTPRGKSAPALPAARAPRRAPRGVAFPPAPPPPTTR